MDDIKKQRLSALPDESLESIAGGMDEVAEKTLINTISVYKKMGWPMEEMLEDLRNRIPDGKDWKDEYLAFVENNWDFVEPMK